MIDFPREQSKHVKAEATSLSRPSPASHFHYVTLVRAAQGYLKFKEKGNTPQLLMGRLTKILQPFLTYSKERSVKKLLQ